MTARKQANSPPPGVAEILEELRAAGTAQTLKTYRRHGATDDTWGVSFAVMGKLARRLKGQTALATQLWESGVTEARILATMIAEPAELSRSTLEAWLRGASNRMINGAFASLVARSPAALELAQKWIASEDEWIAASGFNVIADAVCGGQGGDEDLHKVLSLIEREIHSRPNYTRYAMNGALIAIGSYVPSLTERALAVAAAIGKVEVDHRDTNCKTPAAAAYIHKTLAHLERKRGTNAQG